MKSLTLKESKQIANKGVNLYLDLLKASSKNEDEFRELFRETLVSMKEHFNEVKDGKYPKDKSNSQEAVVKKVVESTDKLVVKVGLVVVEEPPIEVVEADVVESIETEAVVTEEVIND